MINHIKLIIIHNLKILIKLNLSLTIYLKTINLITKNM